MYDTPSLVRGRANPSVTTEGPPRSLVDLCRWFIPQTRFLRQSTVFETMIQMDGVTGTGTWL